MFDTSSSKPTKPTRCVIYTRKSSEEGLEQEFNSLDAQREACEAYIKSQAHEGWFLVDKKYDDGGFSGGNMKRPALLQLMDDIKTGKIDLIIVYKVDRLSRSLADFSNMVETFDGHNVSFVSITQQFNTSTSMGRLTLNVLLSFAQFEREVTGERIRDKVAASKKKGMWMGGYVPLGYDNVDKNLIVNPKEASTIRYIFNEYLTHGSVKKLKESLDKEGFITKVGKSGYGGNEFSRGALYAILQNPIYIGKIKHKDQVHNGNHDAILDKQQWKKVQDLLKTNCSATYKRTDAKDPSLLTGLLFDPKNHPLSPSHTRKKNRRYRYYVNQALIQFKQIPDDAVTRVPAQVIEELVQNNILSILQNKSSLLQIVKPFNLAAAEQKLIVEEAKELAESWYPLDMHKRIELCNLIISKITLSRTSVDIQYSVTDIANLLLEHANFQEHVAYQSNIAIEIKRCGIETKLIIEGEFTQESLKPHADSLKAIQLAVKQGLIWNQELVSGKAESAKSIAKGIDVSDRYVCQCVKLAVLSPDIIKRIFQGDIPHDMTLKKLKAGVPFDWSKQERLFA
jgi:DNA invertase Pin-like site-specific DNA recombinase